MDNKSAAFEPRNDAEMDSTLEVLYEMAVGYVLGELRDEHPASYEKLTISNRFKTILVNNIRYSIDIMLKELIEEYSDQPSEDYEEL